MFGKKKAKPQYSTVFFETKEKIFRIPLASSGDIESIGINYNNFTGHFVSIVFKEHTELQNIWILYKDYNEGLAIIKRLKRFYGINAVNEELVGMYNRNAF